MSVSDNSRPPTIRERMKAEREGAPVQSNDRRESSENETQESAETSRKPQSLRELFSEEASSRGDDDNTSGRQGEDGGESRRKPSKLTDLNSLAETLGVKPEDLYKVKVPLGGDKSLSLGEIKDLATKDHDFDAREFEFEERRSKQESDLLRAKNEIQELLEIIPPKLLNKDLLDKARTKYDTFVQAQRRETLNLIPEWKDEKVREAEMAEMIDHMADYGISKAEFMNLVDAKAIRYIRVNMLRQKRVDKIMEQVKAQNPKSGAPARSSGGKPPKRPALKESRKNDNGRARLLQIME